MQIVVTHIKNRQEQLQALKCVIEIIHSVQRGMVKKINPYWNFFVCVCAEFLRSSLKVGKADVIQAIPVPENA